MITGSALVRNVRGAGGVWRRMSARRRGLNAGLVKLARGTATLDGVTPPVSSGHVPEAGHVDRRGMPGGNLFGQGGAASAAPSVLRQLGRPATSVRGAGAMPEDKGCPPTGAENEFASGSLAGTLAPQGIVRDAGRCGRFDDVKGRHWHVLTFDPDLARRLRGHRAALAARLHLSVVTLSDEPGGLEDVDGRYREYFARHGIAALLVRPDFHVYGAAVDAAAAFALLDGLRLP